MPTSNVIKYFSQIGQTSTTNLSFSFKIGFCCVGNGRGISRTFCHIPNPKETQHNCTCWTPRINKQRHPNRLCPQHTSRCGSWIQNGFGFSEMATQISVFDFAVTSCRLQQQQQCNCNITECRAFALEITDQGVCSFFALLWHLQVKRQSNSTLKSLNNKYYRSNQ